MKYLILAFIFLVGCVVPAPAPSLPSVQASPPGDILEIALNSDCAKAKYLDRGTPPKNYLKGIALSYARSVCNPNSEQFKIISQPLGDASKDALAHYGLNPKDENDRLDLVYSLMVGSAGRESSWRWCVGRDQSAFNVEADTCEAGLYQTSFNSKSASPVLLKIFESYKASNKGCFADEYKGKTTCKENDLTNYGIGEGVKFQELSKSCPGFATEYHAVMLRVRRSHYGPVNRKTSEIKPVCTDMFGKIRKAVKASPEICEKLL